MTRIAYRFTDAALRERALTHRSAGADNNERLEFFGDALVNAVVAELLFEEFPKAAEGELTRLRARLVSEPALAAIARGLDLGDALHLGPGELKSGGFRRDSILADAFEAIVGAVYLDGGWAVCRGFVRALVAPRIEAAATMDDKDAKTRLQEWLQSRGEPLPAYELVATSGADHARVFDVECRIDSYAVRAAGRGSSRRAAEQAAAGAALALLQPD
ncbi:MAG: ribonuclease III [Rudaea sp.]|uniref:ribonuclease III n=1 Tax=Rudaea sp. TaxID=2136325 RepID=UPI0039E3C69A